MKTYLAAKVLSITAKKGVCNDLKLGSTERNQALYDIEYSSFGGS